MITIGTLPQWTPCEEGLPETEGRYLVTYMLGEMPWVSILNYGVPYTADEKDNVWYYADDEYGDVVYDDVLAWMPLQEPYKPKVNKGKRGTWECLGHVEIMDVMRTATAEESESVNEYVESISVKTGANVLDGDIDG